MTHPRERAKHIHLIHLIHPDGSMTNYCAEGFSNQRLSPWLMRPSTI